MRLSLCLCTQKKKKPQPALPHARKRVSKQADFDTLAYFEILLHSDDVSAQQIQVMPSLFFFCGSLTSQFTAMCFSVSHDSFGLVLLGGGFFFPSTVSLRRARPDTDLPASDADDTDGQLFRD